MTENGKSVTGVKNKHDKVWVPDDCVSICTDLDWVFPIDTVSDVSVIAVHEPFNSFTLTLTV